MSTQSPSRTPLVLLACALAWAALLLLLTFVLPVYTITNGKVGPQPRYTLAEHFGPASLWPSLISIVLVLVSAALLFVPARSARRPLVIAARVLAILAAVAAVGALAFFRFPGSLLLPVAVLLVVAAFLAPARTARRR